MSEIKFDKRKDNELWLYCNQCNKDTSHKILTGVDCNDCAEIEPNFDIQWWQGADVVQCGGCKNVTFTKRSTDSESCYPGDRDVIVQLPPKEENASSHVRDNIYECAKQS